MLPWTCEWLVNVRRLHVYTASDIDVETQLHMRADGIDLRTPMLTEWIQFPTRVDVDSKTISLNYAGRTQLGFKTTSHISLLSETAAVSSTQLTKDDVVAHDLLCSCGAVLVAGHRIVKAFPLPSEYWLELVDCWVCHTENYKQLSKGELLPQANTVLYSDSLYLVHPADAQETLVADDLSISKVRGVGAAKNHVILIHLDLIAYNVELRSMWNARRLHSGRKARGCGLDLLPGAVFGLHGPYWPFPSTKRVRLFYPKCSDG